MKFSRHALGAAAALSLTFGAAVPAHAVFVAAICDDIACTGSNDIFVQDNGAGDTIGAAGGISFSTAAFGYSLVVNTSQSKPLIGSAQAPQLDLTYSATTAATGAEIRSVFLYASDTDFASNRPYTLALGGTNSNGGTVTGRAWGGSDNTAMSFSGANLLATVGPLSGVAVSGTADGSFGPIVSLPYSLTVGVEISRGPGAFSGTSTGDLNFQVQAIPEPETYALMMAGLGALGFVARRRRRG